MKQLVEYQIVKCRNNNYKINCYKVGLDIESYSFSINKTEVAYITYVAMPNYYEIMFRENTKKPIQDKSQKHIRVYSLKEAFEEAYKFSEEYIQNIEKELQTMQTVLESLECSYINILNLESEANRNGDTYVREEIYEAKKELIKAIFLLVVTQDVLPTDSRVYLDLIETSIYKESQSEEIKKEFMEKLYNAEILHREKTIGDLIEELKQYSPNLKVEILGVNNAKNKVVVDDTYTDKVVLVGVNN